jgi:hypothetical protein
MDSRCRAYGIAYPNKKAGQCPAFKSPCLFLWRLVRALAMIGLFTSRILLFPSNTLAPTRRRC